MSLKFEANLIYIVSSSPVMAVYGDSVLEQNEVIISGDYIVLYGFMLYDPQLLVYESPPVTG